MNGLELIFSFGRYSIFLTLLGPVYIFASGEYKDPPKLAIAILTIFVILTTYMYWDKKLNEMNKNIIWKILDRLTAATIVILPLIYGDGDARLFLSLGIYFYLLGSSSNWNTYNGHLNHNAFRYLSSIGLILYIVRREQTLYTNLFAALSTILFVFGTFLIIRNTKNLRRDKYIKYDTIIF